MKSTNFFPAFFMTLIVLSGPALFGEKADNEAKKQAFRFSFSHRTRFVSWNNAVHLDGTKESDSTFTRHRTSIGFSWNPSRSWTLNAKLTNEFRVYFVPSDREFHIHEFFFDNLNIVWKNPGGIPLTFTLGRQNIMLGEGFVVMDGHPLDGSRSIYFNAARMDLRIQDGHNLLFFYSRQPKTDTWLPVINSRDQALIEQPEEGITLYYTGHIGKAALDAYLIRKNIKKNGPAAVGSGINTAGARCAFSFSKNWRLTGEAALQQGSYGDFGRNAFGGYIHLDRVFKSRPPAPSLVTAGGIFLSGDDPETPGMEGWDPLFSRWPKWSESYIYTLIPEYGGRVAYWSNLASLYGSVRFSFGKPAYLDVTYHHLLAPETQPPGSAFVGGRGKTRGELFISKLNLRLTEGLTGHILWEAFLPGNYYRRDAEGYSWFRMELMYRY